MLPSYTCDDKETIDGMGLDAAGGVVALTFEHARSRADLAHLSYDLPTAA